MDLHGEALSRMMERISEHEQAHQLGDELIDSLAKDSVISSLLLVYNLHPLALEARVRAALDSVRPYLASHGGSVELLGVSEEGEVNLQMQGSCHGCPSSAVTLKDSIEKSIYDKAPDVIAIHVQGLETVPAIHVPNNGFVPVGDLTAGRVRRSLEQVVPLSGVAIC
jgi:Fe-S cluster biogenesis protein NfuA